jgi:hypothetical protein
MKRIGLAVALAMSATNCSWCSGPKATTEDDPSDLDAAPREDRVHARCGDSPASHIALPTTSDAAFELGRVREDGTRIVIGARRGERGGLLEVDGLTARFTETSDAIGDAPPPIPLLDGTRTIAIAYEGAGKSRRLVARDAASSATPMCALDPEPPDESLAFDATALGDGAFAIAWDAPPPNEPDDGSAIWARAFRGGKLGDAVRLSPHDVDADTPRLVAFGPTLVALWISHRAIPHDRDAAALPEGPGQDLDHAWVEMLAFDAATLAPISPLRHVTPDTGRVTAFDVIKDSSSPLPAMTVVARDGIELQAGQGGSALVVHVAGPDPSTPIVMSNHVGRGLPLYVPSHAFLLFDDPTDVARSVNDAGSALEAFTAERPLAALPSGDVIFAKDRAKDLDVFHCNM